MLCHAFFETECADYPWVPGLYDSRVSCLYGDGVCLCGARLYVFHQRGVKRDKCACLQHLCFERGMVCGAICKKCCGAQCVQQFVWFVLLFSGRGVYPCGYDERGNETGGEIHTFLLVCHCQPRDTKNSRLCVSRPYLPIVSDCSDALANPQAFRCHFEKFIRLDELQCLLQTEDFGRR